MRFHTGWTRSRHLILLILRLQGCDKKATVLVNHSAFIDRFAKYMLNNNSWGFLFSETAPACVLKSTLHA
jgi:hypothetical protein